MSLESVRAACERAKRLPSEQNSFRRLRLNQWVKQETRFVDMSAWDHCAGSVDLAALKELLCYAGLDLSTKLDVTALVLVFRDDDAVFQVVPYFWLPSDNLSDRVNQESDSYRHWARSGFMTLTEGNVIDFAAILQRVIELRDQAELQIRQIAFDPWNGQQFAQQLTEDGFHLIEVSQTYRHLSEPTKELQAAVIDGKVRHGGHPVLRWMADCLTVKQDFNGNVRPVKPDRLKSSRRIDGMVALIMALSRAMVDDNSESVYSHRGILTI